MFMKYTLSSLKKAARIAGISSLSLVAALAPLTTATYAETTTTNTETTQTTETTPTTSGSTSTEKSTTTTQQNVQARLTEMKTKGDQEIARRLATLNTLVSKINDATKLTSSDKTALTTQVNSTISGLTDLKTKLDSDTTIDAARTDVQAIYSQYRVYALVAPKTGLIKVSDDQQAVETKLTALAQKLQTRITAAQQANKDVSSLQAELNDLNSKVAAAQAISTKVESSTIGLEPTDYNSDHGVLSGYNDQLKTARSDDQAAITDAKNIIAGLKALK